jgi:hypothetical protein
MIAKSSPLPHSVSLPRVRGRQAARSPGTADRSPGLTTHGPRRRLRGTPRARTAAAPPPTRRRPAGELELGSVLVPSGGARLRAHSA